MEGALSRQDNETLVEHWEQWKYSGEFGGQSYTKLKHQLRELEITLANSGVILGELQHQLLGTAYQ